MKINEDCHFFSLGQPNPYAISRILFYVDVFITVGILFSYIVIYGTILFQQYFSYIMAISFIGWRSRSTRREPPTTGKQLVNCITCGSVICVKHQQLINISIIKELYFLSRLAILMSCDKIQNCKQHHYWAPYSM
jgi:hypothetical protein